MDVILKNNTIEASTTKVMGQGILFPEVGHNDEVPLPSNLPKDLSMVQGQAQLIKESWKQKGKETKEYTVLHYEVPNSKATQTKRRSSTKLKEVPVKKGRSIYDKVQICFLHEVPVVSSAYVEFNPTDNHENHLLEFLWAWEPTGNFNTS